MTNLEIIKHLANTNPSRLAELLDDIYCTAWNCGSYAGGTGNILEECEIDDFNEWINQDASKSGFYYDEELEEWSKAIDNPYEWISVEDRLPEKAGQYRVVLNNDEVHVVFYSERTGFMKDIDGVVMKRVETPIIYWMPYVIPSLPTEKENGYDT